MKKILGIVGILLAVVAIIIGTYMAVMANISITAIDENIVQIECFGNIWEYLI